MSGWGCAGGGAEVRSAWTGEGARLHTRRPHTRRPYTRRPYTSRPYTSKGLHRYRHALDDLAQHLFGLFGFFQGGSVERSYDYALGKAADDEGFEIFASAVIAPLEEFLGLGAALVPLLT